MVFSWRKSQVAFSAFVFLFSMYTSVYAQNNEQVIPYPQGYCIDQAGASSYHGVGNAQNSGYFNSLDFFHMKSNQQGLTILSHYKTYQQTTETTCGPAAALTVLYHFGNKDYEELQLADLMGCLTERNERGEIGTSTSNMAKFFSSIGWSVESSQNHSDAGGMSFTSPSEFKAFVLEHLKNSTPIMVENIDWGGHWRVIIGYDTINTEQTHDDILIMMDSYDVADHKQDGYVVQSMEKFYYTWFDINMLPTNQKNQQWLAVKPKK